MGLSRCPNGMAALAMGLGLATATPAASAQMSGAPGPSLGGYGGREVGAMAGSVGEPMLIPYGGSFEGFLPGRMDGSPPLSFRPRPSAPMAARRKDFRLSTTPRMAGGRARSMESLGDRGDILGGLRRRPRSPGAGVMPPRIGYPFRQPPRLVGPSAGGIGM